MHDKHTNNTLALRICRTPDGSALQLNGWMCLHFFNLNKETKRLEMANL